MQKFFKFFRIKIKDYKNENAYCILNIHKSMHKLVSLEEQPILMI